MDFIRVCLALGALASRAKARKLSKRMAGADAPAPAVGAAEIGAGSTWTAILGPEPTGGYCELACGGVSCDDYAPHTCDLLAQGGCFCSGCHCPRNAGARSDSNRSRFGAPERFGPRAGAAPASTLESRPRGRQRGPRHARRHRRLEGGHKFGSKYDLVVAVHAWYANPTSAKANYGNITTWDVSNITDMSGLFCGSSSSGCPMVCWQGSCMSTYSYSARSFNEDISDWDARRTASLKIGSALCLRRRFRA